MRKTVNPFDSNKQPAGTSQVRTAILNLIQDPDLDPGMAAQYLVETIPGAGMALAWLMAFDSDDQCAETAVMFLMAAIDDQRIPVKIRNQVKQDSRPWLKKGLKDASVSDSRKFRLGPLLSRAGEDLPIDEYHACFKDFDAVQKTMSKSLNDMIDEKPERLLRVLSICGLYPECDEKTIAQSLMQLGNLAFQSKENNPNAEVMLLSLSITFALQHKCDPEQINAVLDVIRRQGSSRARWCLEELSQWPGLGAKALIAHNLANELNGVKAQGPFLPCDFSHAIATIVDGFGSRAVLVFRRTPEGGMDALSMMLNDHTGIKDSWAVFQTGCEIEKYYRDASEKIAFANISLNQVNELVADALAIHAEQNLPLPGHFFALRPFLGEAHIAAKRRKPNLGAYALETLSRSPKLVEGTDSLADSILFSDLWPASDAAYKFVEGVMPKRGLKLPEAICTQFVEQVILQEKKVLLERMAINLEVEAWAGRAKTKENQRAARLWLGLSENVTPFHLVPFIQKLARNGIHRIIGNLRLGHHTQREVNDAGIKHEQEFEKIMEELSQSLEPGSTEPAEFMEVLRHILRGEDYHAEIPIDLFDELKLQSRKPKRRKKKGI